MATKKRSAPADDKTADQKADDAILKRSRDGLKAQIDAEESERRLMLDDARFADLDQWPPEIRKARESDPNGSRPCLTSDKLNQFLIQIVNDSRKDKPGIKVRPVDDKADVKTAKVDQEMIRHIEDQTNAQVAYCTSIESAAKIGLGFLRVTTEYVQDSYDQQELKIVRVPNTFACYLGPHINPDGSDAEEGWIFEEMSVAAFKAKFPRAKYAKTAFEDLPPEMGVFWRSEEKVVVCEYFYIKRTPAKLLFLEDGSSMYEDEWLASEPKIPVAVDEEGEPKVRESMKCSVKWCKHTGAEIIEKRDWAGQWIPLVEVVGRESYLEGKRKLWGIVRPAKDPLRAYNYWLSTITEKIGLSPKAPYIAAEGQIEGHEEEWAKANVENRSVLQYKAIDVHGNAVAPPRRQEPSQVEAGMMAMLPMLERNVQTALGMFRASVGESESQQSGRAILALQRSSDTGTFHFGDNLAISIKHVGRILLDMIPKIYDTKRIVRLTGEDGVVTTAQLDPDQETAAYTFQGPDGKERTSYNLSKGKYDVTVTVGPSYSTKRQEAADAMVEMMKSAPQIMGTHGDLIFKSMDWPMADKFAERFKKMLPPQLQDQEDGQQQVPPQVAAQMAQMQQAGQELQARNAELESGASQAAHKVNADHDAKMKALALDREVEQEKARQAKEKAESEMALKEWVAEQELAIKERDQTFQMDCRAKDEAAKHDEKLQAQAKEDEVNVVPAFMQALQQITQTFAQALEGQQQALTMIAQAVNQPKTVRIGGIQRDSDGRMVGASAVQAPVTVQ